MHLTMKELEKLISKAAKELDKKRDKVKDGKGIDGYERKEGVQPVGFDQPEAHDMSKPPEQGGRYKNQGVSNLGTYTAEGVEPSLDHMMYEEIFSKRKRG